MMKHIIIMKKPNKIKIKLNHDYSEISFLRAQKAYFILLKLYL